jgi:hypothetical protein
MVVPSSEDDVGEMQICASSSITFLPIRRRRFLGSSNPAQQAGTREASHRAAGGAYATRKDDATPIACFCR